MVEMRKRNVHFALQSTEIIQNVLFVHCSIISAANFMKKKKTSCNANNSEFSLELIDPLDCDGIACENASQLYYFWFKNI